MGRGRETEAEQGIDQVNRSGPSSQPTQTHSRCERRELEVYACMYRLMTSPYSVGFGSHASNISLLSFVITVPCGCGNAAFANTQPDAAASRRGTALHSLGGVYLWSMEPKRHAGEGVVWKSAT